MLLALVALGTLALASGARAATVPPGFQESTAFSGLTNPTAVRFASDGRVFVAEKSGLVKVFDSLSDTTPTVFADLRTQVHNYWDRGLLGLALDPDFPATPYVYVLYAYDKDPFDPMFPRWGTPGATGDPCPSPPDGPGPTTDGCVGSGRLSRLTASGNVMSGPEEVLIEDWCQQYPSHSLGDLAFGQDGKLYVSGGDGASFIFADYGQKGDPPNPCGDPPVPRGGAQTPPGAEGGALRSQDVRTSADPAGLNGTVLRLDPDDASGAAGNPLFSSSDPNARRIVAAGLRNPFRFTIRPGTNELWIGDVGWNKWEEIDRLSSGPSGEGRNFGWPCYEGPEPDPSWISNLNICSQLDTSGGSPTDLVNGTATGPFFTYQHSAQVVAGESCPTGSSSISGLDFYDAQAYPASYDGALFFADYSRDCIWAMRTGADGLPDPANLETFVAEAANPVDVQIGPDGRLYYVDFDGGTIRRVNYFVGNQPPVAVAEADPTAGPSAPMDVEFDGSGSSDPDPPDTLSYAWDLDGDGEYDDSSSVTPTHTYDAPGIYPASLEVADNHGASSRASVVIEVGHRPVPQIITPTPATTWEVGQRIDFAGSASDIEDGALPTSALDWRLILHHCPSNCHPHQLESFPDTDSGFFNAPDHDYPSHLELELTATDLSGATGTTSVALDPRTVDLTLDSLPAGLDLTLDSETAEAPFTTTVIEGSNNSIGAPSPQTMGGQSHSWLSWSDGGAQIHNITASASTTYSATFTDPGGELTLPGPPDPGLELQVEAKKKQRPAALAVDVSCPQEPCAVTASGKARGLSFEVDGPQASLQAGEPDLLRLRATNRRKLARLKHRLESGDRPVIAKIEVTGTRLDDGAKTSKLVKVQLEA